MVSDQLSRKTKFLYGVGDTGFSLTSTILGAYFLIFLTDVVGVAPGIAAIAIFVGRSWDYINDPIFGHLSDRTRTRWGRRRPFLLFGALPFALAFALLWWRPPWDNVVFLAIYYGAAYVVFDAAATLVQVPLERAERVRVILQLEVHLADVVENVEVRRELVGAAELDEGGVVIALFEELEALLEAGRGLLLLRLRGLLSEHGGGGSGERERGGEGEDAG